MEDQRRGRGDATSLPCLFALCASSSLVLPSVFLVLVGGRADFPPPNHAQAEERAKCVEYGGPVDVEIAGKVERRDEMKEDLDVDEQV